MKDPIKIEFKPDLTCCVGCMAERYYWKLADEYMISSEDEPEVEEKIEMLRTFLEEYNLEKIRSETEELLIEGREPTVILEGDSKKLRIEISANQRFARSYEVELRKKGRKE